MRGPRSIDVTRLTLQIYLVISPTTLRADCNRKTPDFAMSPIGLLQDVRSAIILVTAEKTSARIGSFKSSNRLRPDCLQAPIHPARALQALNPLGDVVSVSHQESSTHSSVKRSINSLERSGLGRAIADESLASALD